MTLQRAELRLSAQQSPSALTVPGSVPQGPPGDMVQEVPAEGLEDRRESNENDRLNLAMNLTASPVLDRAEAPQSTVLGPIQNREAVQAVVLGTNDTTQAPDTLTDSTAVQAQAQDTTKRSLKPQVSFLV